jgi:hypothetical protein
MPISGRIVCLVTGAAALALATPALAAHGKAGLWNVTVTTNAGGAAMPDMSKLPPEAQAMMRARGMNMSGHSITVQHCMTQAEVDAASPPAIRQKECKIANARTSGNSFSADMTCSGEMTGTGHMEVTYDSPEHYAGKSTMNGQVNGHPMATSTSFEGRWVGADCKGVTH